MISGFRFGKTMKMKIGERFLGRNFQKENWKLDIDMVFISKIGELPDTKVLDSQPASYGQVQ